MNRARTFFIIDDLVFETDKPEITLKKIIVTQVKFENEEYKELRKIFSEDFYHFEKSLDGWIVYEKE